MKLSPFRIAAIYLVAAMVWIITSDLILEVFVKDPGLLTTINIVKGWFFVIITALGLYYLVRLNEQEINREKQKLERKDKSLTLALESNRMATWEYFPDTDKYVTSSNHHSFFGFSQSRDLSLKDVYERIHPDDLERFKKKVARTLSTRQQFNIEYRVILEDGSLHWFWTRGMVYTDEDKIEKVAGITSDITESKTLKRTLDLEREKFETLFDRIPVLINVFNQDFIIHEVNREFERVLGWTPAEDDGEDPLKIFYPDEATRREVIEHMKEHGAGWKEFKVMTKSGEIRHQLWTNVRLSDSTIVGIGHDITERKKLEEKKVEDRDRLLDIFNKLPIFINVLDNENRIVECNDFVLERLGYDKRVVLDGNLLDKMIHDDKTSQQVKRHIEKADNSWQSFEIYTNEGDKLKTSWMNLRLNDSLKLGVGLDLTELKELEEQLSLAVTGGNIGLWDYYPKLSKIQINEEWAKMLGYSREELEPLLYAKWQELTHPEDLAESERLLQLHFENKSPSYSNEIRMKHKDGHWVWMLDRGVVAERDQEGNVIRITGTHIDISERKQLEEQVEISRTRLKQATNSANIGLWEWNPQTGEVSVDEIWANLVGYTLEELQPVNLETWNKLVHPDDLKRFEKTVDDYFSGKTDMYEIEVRMRHKKGHWVWILDRGKNVASNDKGEPIKMIGTHVDITNLKQKEKQLRKSEHLLMETQRVANLGTYTLEIDSKIAHTSAILGQMFWLPEGESVTLELWEELLHPDFKYIARTYEQAIEEEEPFEAEYKIRNPKDRRERWIYEKANVEYDRQGVAIRMIGVMLDVTRSKEQELRIKRTLAQLKKAEEIAEIGYWEKNLSTEKVFWGDNKYKLYGQDPATGPVSRQKLFQ